MASFRDAPLCETCRFVNGLMCTKPMRLQDGEERYLPRVALAERDDRHPDWKKLKRRMDDVCGKAGRNWQAKK